MAKLASITVSHEYLLDHLAVPKHLRPCSVVAIEQSVHDQANGTFKVYLTSEQFKDVPVGGRIPHSPFMWEE